MLRKIVPVPYEWFGTKNSLLSPNMPFMETVFRKLREFGFFFKISLMLTLPFHLVMPRF